MRGQTGVLALASAESAGYGGEFPPLIDFADLGRLAVGSLRLAYERFKQKPAVARFAGGLMMAATGIKDELAARLDGTDVVTPALPAGGNGRPDPKPDNGRQEKMSYSKPTLVRYDAGADGKIETGKEFTEEGPVRDWERLAPSE